MKKALLIKIEAPSYSSIGMENAFKEHFEVSSIDWQKERFMQGLEGLWDKVIKGCITFKPDLIFCQIQLAGVFTVEQWKKLSSFGFVINYTEDVRENIDWYDEIGGLIGLTIFTNKDDVKRFKHNNVAYMMVPYNDVWYKPQPKTDKYYGDIVFIGNNYVGTNLNFPKAQERQDMIKFMEEKFGDKFHAYGLGQRCQMLSPMECVEAYNNAKVVITQNNFERDGYCSDRGINALACGARVIQQYFTGCTNIFNEAPHLLTWDSFESLEGMCKAFLLDDTPYKSKEMAVYIKENHSWKNRIKFVLGFIKLIKNNSITI